LELEWSDIGGAPILDFLNTAGGGAKARGSEGLPGHAAVLAWGEWSGLLSPAEAASLRGRFARPPLIARREALHAVLSAASASRPAPADALAVVGVWLSDARSRAVLEGGDGGYAWRARSGQSGGDLLSDRLALEAERLLTGADLAAVRECERCSWLFLGGGRGRPRRWCSMAACGNREKSARHYARKKTTPQTPD
jgi:predicted RNA-binding Zn ribbon-like protein